MGDEKRKYKQFLLQRNVLDSLRVYLDLTEEFLDGMEQKNILTADELIVVKGLRWPSNRNELLQMIVRKPWKRDQFDKFCGILEKTQHEQLIKLVVVKARSFIKERKEEETRTKEDSSFNDFLDIDLGKVDIRAKTNLRLHLKERDDEIRNLKAENSELRTYMNKTVCENHELRQKFYALDQMVMNLLAELNLQSDPEQVDVAIKEVKTSLETRQSKIEKLKREKKELKSMVASLRERISVFTDENKNLKTLCQNLQERLDKDAEIAALEIAKLKENLIKQKGSNQHLKQTTDNMQSLFQTNASGLQQELAETKTRLVHKTKDLEIANAEKKRIKDELSAVQEKSRKLLFTLDLTNDTMNPKLALDHARNLSYARRRKPLTQQVAERQSGAFTEEDVEESVQETISRIDDDSPNEKESRYLTESITPAPNTNSTFHAKDIATSPSHITNGLTQPVQTDKIISPSRSDEIVQKCQNCGKIYVEASNFEGACLQHVAGSVLMYEGTELAVWSCCKSVDRVKGCVNAKHAPEAVVNGVVNSMALNE